MTIERWKFYAVIGAVAFNLLLFILAAQIVFLPRVHHHWILAWVPVALGIQLALAEIFCARFAKSLSRSFRATLLGLLFFSCLVGLARHETILTCYEHCGFKLAFMLGLSGLIFAAASVRLEKNSGWVKAYGVASALLLATGLLILRLSH